MKTIVFNTGFGRSGSTLLDMVLNSHSKVFSVGGLITIDYELSKLGDSACGCHQLFKQCKFWNHIIENINQRKEFNIRENLDLFSTKIPGKTDLYSKYKYRVGFLFSIFGLEFFYHQKLKIILIILNVYMNLCLTKPIQK